MKNRRSSYWPFYIALSAIVGVLVGIYISGKNTTFSKSSISERVIFEKLSRILALIETKYVEQVNVDSLMDFAINDILHRLDPHSSFIDSVHSSYVEEEISGKYYGAGIEFTMLRDTAVVLSVFPGSPAEKAGLMAGDKLLAIGSEKLYEAPYRGDLQRITSLIKKSDQNKLRISFLRRGAEKSQILFKDWISIPSVSAAFYLPDGVALIKIDRFTENTFASFAREARKLRIDTAVGVILDIRDNPGGLLIEAVRIAREFLSEGDTVVIVEDRNKSREAVRSASNGRYRNVPLIVLVNDGSASASEVLAGAIQDNSRGIIAGIPTFGKGLVQEESLMPDGSRVRITTARYYTPTGRSIQSPYLSELHERNRKEDKIHTSKNGKTLHEKGGIHPDIPMKFKELNYYSQSIHFLINPGESMFDYVSVHGDSLRHLGFERFLSEFNPSFEEALQMMGIVKPSKAGATQEMSDMTILHVKATIAHMIFGPQAGRRIILMHDPSILNLAHQMKR